MLDAFVSISVASAFDETGDKSIIAMQFQPDMHKSFNNN